MNGYRVRAERSADAAAITAVIDAAFHGMPYAEGDEAALVVELRRRGDLSVSLVAEVQARVVGQIAFSPARPADGSAGWYGLGPVAVLPAHQGAGVGSALMQAGLAHLASLGARGCILVGHPGLYRRFGFVPAPAHAPDDEPAEFFMLKCLQGSVPPGPIRFHPAFKGEP